SVTKLSSCTQGHTLSLHDALPICCEAGVSSVRTTPSRRSFTPGFPPSQRERSSAATPAMARASQVGGVTGRWRVKVVKSARRIRPEEHTSELQSRRDLVCRLLLRE